MHLQPTILRIARRHRHFHAMTHLCTPRGAAFLRHSIRSGKEGWFARISHRIVQRCMECPLHVLPTLLKEYSRIARGCGE
jgi:hypothetical protein